MPLISLPLPLFISLSTPSFDTFADSWRTRDAFLLFSAFILLFNVRKSHVKKMGRLKRVQWTRIPPPPPPKNSLSTIITSLSFLLFFNLIHKLDHLLLWRALHVQTRRYQVVLTCLTWDTNMEDSTHLPWKDAFIKNFLVVVFRGVKWVV